MNTVTVKISGDDTPRQFGNIPWYAGMTALNAMIMADAMTEPAGQRGTADYKRINDYGFRVTYSSMFGAFVDQVGDTANGAGKYWMLYVYAAGQTPQPSQVGVSEAVILESAPGQIWVVEWRFEAPSTHPVSKRAVALTGALSRT